MFNLVAFIKGFLIEDELDRSKQLAFEIDPSASPNTRTTIIAAQTADRTVTLPDSNFDFNTVLTDSSVNTLTNKTINADLNTLSNIDNNEIKAAAAIDLTKLAALTANRVLQSNGSGFISASAVTNTTLAFLDATSSIQTQLNSKMTNPMTTFGDIIYGGASGAPTRLAGDTSNVRKFLRELSVAGVAQPPVWDTVASTDLTGTLAINQGGTGQTTANAALNALLPSQATHNGQFLKSDGTNTSWADATAVGIAARNYLYNGDFSIWQRNTTINSSGVNHIFTTDRWFIDAFFTGGSFNCVQTSPTTAGSTFAASLTMTSTGGGNFGPRITQMLETKDMLAINNQVVSFSILIKAIGATNSVRLQWVSSTGDNTNYSLLGSPVSVAVNSSTFTLCKFENFSVSAIGAFGISIMPDGASSGNASVINNGMVIEQAMLNVGSTAATWQKGSTTYGQELARCQRYYEKSSDQTIFVGNSSARWQGTTQYFSPNTTSASTILTPVHFAVAKRINGGIGGTISVVTWNPGNGTASQAGNRSGGANQTISISAGDIGESGFAALQGTVVSNQQYAFAWACDAELPPS